jgi:hypothetical protein
MKKFLKDMLERAIKTAAQTAIATIGATATFGSVDWKIVGSTALLATITSILTSIVSKNIGDSDSASLIKSENGDE